MHMRHNGASRTLLRLIDGVTTIKLKHKKPCTVELRDNKAMFKDPPAKRGLPYL